MRYAVISEDVVINVVMWNGVDEWDPGEGLIAVAVDDEAVDIGWSYVDSNFVSPGEDEPAATEGEF